MVSTPLRLLAVFSDNTQSVISCTLFFPPMGREGEAVGYNGYSYFSDYLGRPVTRSFFTNDSLS